MDTKEKMYHFIVNTTASSGAASGTWETVRKILSEENIAYKVYFPENRDNTVDLTRKLTGNSDEECHLVVLGGDGTLNAVLQGIESFERTKLSCICTGSGNDFAGNMHITKDAGKALNGILHHPEESVMDYGELFWQKDTDGKEGRRRFLISSGIGYDADICEEVSRSRLKHALNRVHMGKLVYVMVGIKQIFTRHCRRAVIKIDDRESIRVSGLFFAVGMIHACEGGGVPFCPSADPADGLLEICIVRDMPKWKLLLAVMLVYLKKHYLFREVTGCRGRMITITTEKPEWFHMDGETPCKVRRLTLKCRKGLRVVM